MLHLALFTKSLALAASSQLDPVLAVVAAIAIAGIAVIFVALKKN